MGSKNILCYSLEQVTQVVVSGMDVDAIYEIWLEQFYCGCSHATMKRGYPQTG